MMSGYLNFKQTKSAAINKVLRELELAGTSYHDTSQWDESDYLERDDRSHLARIQDAANEAADTIEHLTRERDELVSLIQLHNNGCVCDSKLCGYAPYAPRTCPNCPADWRIELPAKHKGDKP